MAESKREDKVVKLCELCGKPMGDEVGDNHKACEDYGAGQAARDR